MWPLNIALIYFCSFYQSSACCIAFNKCICGLTVCSVLETANGSDNVCIQLTDKRVTRVYKIFEHIREVAHSIVAPDISLQTTNFILVVEKNQLKRWGPIL